MSLIFKNWLQIYVKRSHPDPKPPEIVYDTQRIGRRTKDTSKKSIKQIISSEILGSNNPLQRAQSLPVKLETLQDVDFQLKFEKILFRRKSLNWVGTIVLNQLILHLDSPKSLSSLKSDQEIV